MEHRLYLIDEQKRITLPTKTLDHLDAEPGDYVYFELNGGIVQIKKLKAEM